MGYRVIGTNKSITRQIKQRKRSRLSYREQSMIVNAFTMRAEAVRDALMNWRDPNKLDEECGYPQKVRTKDYKRMFERSDIAERVVRMPVEEAWSVDPEVYEIEDPKKETEFEKLWKELEDTHSVSHYLERVDEVSGIGRFGVLLIGVNDGRTLDKPVRGVDPDTGELKEGFKPKKPRKLLYLIPLDESQVRIAEYERDKNNPRYGQPKMYQVTMGEPTDYSDGDGYAVRHTMVHWTRCVHVADNRKSSNVFGKPRMKAVYNRLLDVRKLLGGSAEMFWKGAFPGYAFEINPEYAASMGLIDNDELKEKMRTEFWKYSEGLQRYLAHVGVEAKSLAPQVADPQGHIDAHLRVIAMVIGVPYRIFLGSEEGKLASSQDLRRGNRWLKKRQNKYISPMVIRPFVDRLIAMGILPKVERFFIHWPDLDTLSEADRADVADKEMTALQKYVTSGIETVVPRFEMFHHILRKTAAEAKMLADAGDEGLKDYLDKKEKEMKNVAKNMPAPTNPLNGKQPGGAGNAPRNGRLPGGGAAKKLSSPRSRRIPGNGSRV